MLASESLPLHYKESIFKQQLKNSDKDLALNAAKMTEVTATTITTTTANTTNAFVSAATCSSSNDINGGNDIKDSGNDVQRNGISPSIRNSSFEFGVANKIKMNIYNDNNNNNFNNSKENSVNNNNNKNYDHNDQNTATNPRADLGEFPLSSFKPSHPSIKHEKFLRDCADEIIKSAIFDGTKRTTKVVEWHDPEELKELFNFKLNKNGEAHDELFKLLQKTIQYSVKTGHPYFINQLYSGLDPYALIGQWLTDSLNPSVYTYEVAPLFILMEEEVLKEMRRIVGFYKHQENSDEIIIEGDGIFCPGGSVSNGYAISCARYKYAPDTKHTGLFDSKRLIVFTSEDAHYSIEKLAMFMGIGSNNVFKIPTNSVGKMDLNELEEKIEQCLKNEWQPLMVSATAGTTVLGAFDDLNGIADICKKYNLWMHVDAAWGGGALMSKKHRHLLKGIERSDSVTWNPHKLLSASQQCSTFLTRHKDILSHCHSTNATYLFQKDKFYNTAYDTGDKHIQCGRRADVLKFWFMWKAKGSNGLEEHVNQVFRMAEYFTEKLKARSGFELVLDKPECTNISFWYVPPSLRNVERNDEFHAKLHKIAPKIKEAMMKRGSMMITYQPLRKLPNFFRLVLQNSCLNEADMMYFLNEIETLGNKL